MTPESDGQRPRIRFRHRAEYAVLRVLAFILSALPNRPALAVGWMAALLLRCVLRSRVHEARLRIRCVLGNSVSERAVRRIAWISLRNIVFNAVEMIRVPRVVRTGKHPHCACEEAIATLTKHAATGEGCIIAAGHLGNWELACVTFHRGGVPIFNIAARQRNPLVNEFLNGLRRAPGIETVERGAGTMRAVISRLRAGQVLAILPDVRVRDPGLSIPFLGGIANLGRGMAAFARQTGVPIHPCIVSRTGWARHAIDLRPPIRSNPALSKSEDIQRMTETVVSIIDSEIRANPEQWFWYNRRWVLEPFEPMATP